MLRPVLSNAVWLLIAAAAAAGADAPPGSGDAPALAVLTEGYPRAFFFRAAEGAAANQRISYEEWDASFGRLMGIEGKVLDEEVPGRSKRNVEFFTRFKRAHPDQLVLLHYNGNARDPRWQGGAFFAGHWLYAAPARILADVPAEAGETDIRVDDASGFRTNTGRYRTSNDDIGLCERAADGRLDWMRSEQVQLISADAARGVIRVRRGCYGTRPRAFAAGSAAARHVAEGPWGRNNNLMWFYNYSTRCPRDPNGLTCADVHARELAGRLAAGGELAAFDGLEFDVLFHGHRGEYDYDGDGAADDGVFQGVNTYGAGVIGFLADLRRRMPAKLILADGHGERHQRGFGLLNGIESEGWPDLRDARIEDWSGGLNRHFFWAANSRPPAFSYVNHKFNEPTGEPGVVRNPDLPFSTHRLVLAAAVFTDSAICYSFAPPKGPDELIGVWDELWCGQARKVGWLGRPLGPAERLAQRAADLLEGAGSPPGEKLLARLAGDAVSFSVGAGGVQVVAVAGSGGDVGTDAGELCFRLRDVPCGGPDLFVRVEMHAEGMAGYPPEMARLVRVGIAAPGGPLVRRDTPPAAMCLRGGQETHLDAATGAAVRFQPACELGDGMHDAYFVHPPYRGGKTGYALWWRDCTVPAGGKLEFFCGMGAKAPERSDGVTFRVEAVAPAGGGTPARTQRIFEHHQKASAWTAHTVPLDRWAGQRVRLRFISDPGPKDNFTTDQSYWGDVAVLGPGGRKALTTPREFMTWAAARPFTSTFYFDDVRSEKVDLEFTVEGRLPVAISRITAHAAADAMCREFANGLVLANPSPRPFEFDLARLLPGKRFRRIEGTPQQDRTVNDGSAVGAKLLLAAKDALFLLRQEASK